jgi:hypothetical protein
MYILLNVKLIWLIQLFDALSRSVCAAILDLNFRIHVCMLQLMAQKHGCVISPYFASHGDVIGQDLHIRGIVP